MPEVLLQAIEGLVDLVGRGCAVREPKIAFARLPERRPWNGDDVRAFEDVRRERHAAGAAVHAHECEEAAARRHPMETWYSREPSTEDVASTREFRQKRGRVIRRLSKRRTHRTLRNHGCADDHRILHLYGVSRDSRIGEHVANSPSCHPKRLRKRANQDDVVAPRSKRGETPMRRPVDEIHVRLVRDDDNVSAWWELLRFAAVRV